ncbi:hypothetical protein SCHPADRAFT_991774 [Schizopora paradoxa]|uniref:Uncharacterized protein n=1 Tax=Schizopora paradoxa TaxID=27342 RepID=A0A0H2SF77_9AGAM|nr:hypothetical protein SCHPADRAFT_991774 [Schizopora paradoxa]
MPDKGKGKQREVNGSHDDVVASRPMSNPSAGSANPSASFPSLWNYVEPALTHIVRSPASPPPSPQPDANFKAPAIDVAYHMGIHTTVYNYFTASRYDVSAAIASSPSLAFAHGLAPPRKPREPEPDPEADDQSAPPSSAGSMSSVRSGKSISHRPPSLAASMAAMFPPVLPRDAAANANAHGSDLYTKLDSFYQETCTEILYSLPPETKPDTGEDNAAQLVPALLGSFYRFSSGARSVDRLLNYVNRHYVKRAVEEDRGWIRLIDVLDLVAQSLSLDDKIDLGLVDPPPATNSRSNAKKIERSRSGNNNNRANSSNSEALSTKSGNPREKIAMALRERRLTLLSQWGYKEDGDAESLARAEASAEAASPVDRVVPLVSMAHRRFREEVVKPLLAAAGGGPGPGGGSKPRAKRRKGGKGGRGVKVGAGAAPPPSAGSISADGWAEAGSGVLPKSRLARAVKAFIEDKDFGGDEQQRKATAAELNSVLGIVGIPIDHVLRRRLEKFAPSTETAV